MNYRYEDLNLYAENGAHCSNQFDSTQTSKRASLKKMSFFKHLGYEATANFGSKNKS